jgi:hypothetical protein
MALFGIGGSYSHSSNQSSSLGQSLGINQSSSLSGSQSTSQSGSQQTSSQSLAFAPLYAALYGSAAGAAGQAADLVPGLQGAAQQLFSGGTQFLQDLGGNAGTDYLTQRVTGPDQAAQAQIGALGSNLGDFFNEQLMPGITANGVNTGGLGNSRDAVARSLAAKQVSGQFAQGAATILGNSQAQRDQAASTLGAQKLQASQTGLSSLGGLFQLLQGGAQAGLAPYQALAQIMGGPTALTQSQGTSQASAEDIAQAISNSFGFDTSYNTSQSTGSSHSTSLNAGVG